MLNVLVGRQCFPSVVSWMEGALIHKDFAVGTVFDIDGALDKFRIEANLKRIICSLLCDRTVLAKLGSAHREVKYGTSEGGALSSLDPSNERPF